MSAKRFIAADMTRALEMVRQQMGPDAVIMSSRRVKQGIEILAAMEPVAGKPEISPADVVIDGVDTPMSSDSSWQQTLATEQAIANSSILNSVKPESPAPVSAPAAERSGAQIAEEIEKARDRMLAAKKAEMIHERSLQKRVEEQEQAKKEPALSVVPSLSAKDVPSKDQADFESRVVSERQQQVQMKALQSELADLRIMLEAQLAGVSRSEVRTVPMLQVIEQRLQKMGISRYVAESVTEELDQNSGAQAAWREALAILSHALPTDDSDIAMEGGVFAFVGATGVGKTTTIAKLAARYVVEQGEHNVTLVTTDTYRIAAQEQLRALGRILNIQVKIVNDVQDLPMVVSSLKSCPLVLIDTAGYRHGDEQSAQQLEVLNRIDNLKTLLVLSSTTQLQMMKASAHAHRGLNLAGCVMTKLDEAVNMGEAISLAIEHKLSVIYTTDGQSIPADIHTAKSHSMVSKAVALHRDQQRFEHALSGQPVGGR